MIWFWIRLDWIKADCKALTEECTVQGAILVSTVFWDVDRQDNQMHYIKKWGKKNKCLIFFCFYLGLFLHLLHVFLVFYRIIGFIIINFFPSSREVLLRNLHFFVLLTVTLNSTFLIQWTICHHCVGVDQEHHNSFCSMKYHWNWPATFL